MTKSRSSLSLELSTKKSLLFHNYDLFLERQSRLFVTANSVGHSQSSDITDKNELLLLDDLTIFAITVRRLVELCRLKSFCNRVKVPQTQFSIEKNRVKFYPKKGGDIGFHTLMNRIIHMSDFRFFDSHKLLNYHVNGGDLADLLRIGKNDDAMERLIYIREQENPPLFLLLRDVVDCSEQVAEKITDTCADAKVFLEISLRV